MEKFLHSDWLREMKFSGNTVQKRCYSVQKEVTKKAIWLANDQRKSQMANEMLALDGSTFAWLRDTSAFVLINNYYDNLDIFSAMNIIDK